MNDSHDRALTPAASDKVLDRIGAEAMAQPDVYEIRGREELAELALPRRLRRMSFLGMMAALAVGASAGAPPGFLEGTFPSHPRSRRTKRANAPSRAGNRCIGPYRKAKCPKRGRLYWSAHR